ENDPFEQLKKVITVFDLRPFDAGREGVYRRDRFQTCLYSRCSLCNGLLEDVPKVQAQEHVPEYVYRTTEDFRKCPACGKFYWEGTHRERLIKKLGDVMSVD
ncbi:MAG: Mut7-C RNAse domain-containing protein, partial [Nitrospirota bacterium]